MNILNEYEAYLQKLDKSPKTIRGYLGDIRQFQKWMGAGSSLSKMKFSDVKAYRAYLVSKNASPNTISRHLASLASFGQWGADKADLFPENPALHIEPLNMELLAPRWLEKSEKRKLLTVVENDYLNARERYPRLWLLRFRDAVMINVLLGTGLRVHELCELHLSDLKISERKGALTVRKGKGMKQRVVPLMLETRRQFSDWLEVRPQATSDYVFIGQRGEQIRPRIVQRAVIRYAEKAGLENVTPHVLRHTYAKSLLNSGASLVEVSKLMGHKSLDSTARYTTPSEKELQYAVEKMGQESDDDDAE